jgi:hypothetical protein
MTIKELLKMLEPYKDDDKISIRILFDDKVDEDNYWVYKVDISEKGESGYPNGEIRLIGGV